MFYTIRRIQFYCVFILTETFSANAVDMWGGGGVLQELMNQHITGSRITIKTVNTGTSIVHCFNRSASVTDLSLSCIWNDSLTNREMPVLHDVSWYAEHLLPLWAFRLKLIMNWSINTQICITMKVRGWQTYSCLPDQGIRNWQMRRKCYFIANLSLIYNTNVKNYMRRAGKDA